MPFRFAGADQQNDGQGTEASAEHPDHDHRAADRRQARGRVADGEPCGRDRRKGFEEEPPVRLRRARFDTDENAVEALVKQIHEEVGQIDILVNNAGIIKRIPMVEMSRKDFQQVIDIDLVGPFIVAKAVLPEMIERKEGKIINMCSMMSELGRETVSAYAAAKGGLKMLTRNICSEYGAYNIQCNAIGPGYIATPQTAPLRERQADGSRHPFDKFICAKTPAGRWLDPSELGGPAVFLASHASDAVNGHVLYVDGGILAYIGKDPSQVND